MIAKIDWYSFSVFVGGGDDRGFSETAVRMREALNELREDLSFMLGMEDTIEPLKGRAPYSHQYRSKETLCHFFFHPKLDHALIEIPGQACDRLMARGFLYDILAATWHRSTRVDIAADILTDTKPSDFIAQRDVARFRSHSSFISESGETEYIGSRTSDRYARVYRYNEPHERAHLLRVEHVLKAEQARQLVPQLTAETLTTVVAQLGNSFGWKHSDWKPEMLSDEKLIFWRPERREGKTIFWLADTIAPLLRKMHHDGTIDARQWFKENVLDLLDDIPF